MSLWEPRTESLILSVRCLRSLEFVFLSLSCWYLSDVQNHWDVGLSWQKWSPWVTRKIIPLLVLGQALHFLTFECKQATHKLLPPETKTLCLLCLRHHGKLIFSESVHQHVNKSFLFYAASVTCSVTEKKNNQWSTLRLPRARKDEESWNIIFFWVQIEMTFLGDNFIICKNI